jgi:Skp family chaperone for outer membrane proteins
MDALRSVAIFTLVAALWLCGSPSPVALAQAPVLDSIPSLEVVRRQLELTDVQYAKLEPIFHQRLAELQTLNTKLQQSASDQERRKVLSDARHGANAFNSQVVRVLSSSQKNAWRKLRDEARKKVD